MSQRALTEIEEIALRKVRDGNMPCDDLPKKQEKDLWGVPVPGERTYRALEKLGLVIFTEEDPIEFDNGTEFTFTAFLELSPEGETALKSRCITLPDEK